MWPVFGLATCVGYYNWLRDDKNWSSPEALSLLHCGRFAKQIWSSEHVRQWLDPTLVWVSGKCDVAVAIRYALWSERSRLCCATAASALTKMPPHGRCIAEYPVHATMICHADIVMNDGAFGNVKRIQQTQYGDRTTGVELHNRNFAALARRSKSRSGRCRAFWDGISVLRLPDKKIIPSSRNYSFGS